MFCSHKKIYSAKVKIINSTYVTKVLDNIAGIMYLYRNKNKHMNNVKAYIEQHKDRFLDELLHLLRVPSISADPEYKQHVLKASEIVKSRLIEAGVLCEICETPGIYCICRKIIDKSLPTVLVYGNYDVQPADPLELWTSGPFEPVIKNTLHPEGAIFARGSCDEKVKCTCI